MVAASPGGAIDTVQDGRDLLRRSLHGEIVAVDCRRGVRANPRELEAEGTRMAWTRTSRSASRGANSRPNDSAAP